MLFRIVNSSLVQIWFLINNVKNKCDIDILANSSMFFMTKYLSEKNVTKDEFIPISKYLRSKNEYNLVNSHEAVQSY